MPGNLTPSYYNWNYTMPALGPNGELTGAPDPYADQADPSKGTDIRWADDSWQHLDPHLDRNGNYDNPTIFMSDSLEGGHAAAFPDTDEYGHIGRVFRTDRNRAIGKILAMVGGGALAANMLPGAAGGVGDVGSEGFGISADFADAAGMLEPIEVGASQLAGGTAGGFLGGLGGSEMAAFPALAGAAEAGGGALASIAPSGLPSGVGGFTPAGAGMASGEAAGPASTGFFGNMGNMVKGAFVNGDGSYNWGNIIKAGGTALSAVGAYHNSQNPGTAAVPAGWNDHLNPTPMNRHVVGLGNDAAYKNYGVSGGEHNFFQSGPATSQPQAGPNMRLNDPTDFSQEPVMRAGGHYIKGAGTGRSDEIDAKLSNDEYVMDAETVALLGDGSPEAGAKKLDQLRQNIRKHKGQQLAKGKFSANAKDPAEYLPVRKAKGGRIRPPMTFNSDLSQAYRGYSIKHNQTLDQFYISKDGAHISSPRSIDEAKKQIDELVGEPTQKYAKGGTVLRAVPKPAVDEGMRAAQLAAVQRFRDAIKDSVPPQPVQPIKKAEGGAVRAMNAFAEDLQREVLAKNPQRVAQLKSQMDSLSPGAGKYFEDGFAKGGKVKSLVESFGKFLNPPVQSSMPPKMALSPEEMAWMVQWLRQNNPQSDALKHFDMSETPDLRGRQPAQPPVDIMKILGQE